MTPHKHAALIKAWADGAEIQVRDLTNYSFPEDCKWKDLSEFDYYIWLPEWEYRIKPKTIKYRNFLWSPEYKWNLNKQVVCVCSEQEHLEQPRTDWKGFIKWLGDWQEVEV